MKGPADVVGRVSALLRALSGQEPGGATTTHLAMATGVPRASTHRLLSTLRAEGFTDRDDKTGNWHLGPEAYVLGLAASSHQDVAEAARPTVHAMARDTGESAFFSCRRGDETVCLIREEGTFPIRSHVLHEGIRFPLGVASAGMAILAFMTGRERAELIRRCDLQSQYGRQHSRAHLEAHIRHTRNAGYAVNPGLIVTGSWGVGAAVFDVQGSPRWALSITGIEARVAPRQEELGKLLLRAAHRLSRSVGNPGGAPIVDTSDLR